jgi:putative transposase
MPKKGCSCPRGAHSGRYLIDPGKPRQNAYIKSFNGKFRDECLNQYWFRDLQEAGLTRPHSSLGHLTPETFRQKLERSVSVV